eukprot:CAMPEP_0185818352 /NCGR_PEP_ID=MMETSP1322-20130828/20516_1 /TAXON_ID=265543 /ORGANISM="Minutocellus polymorphus, Strain RCC2270" /LENGTH=40 /DNA_ID= /DNA_START= /DNA_END= /DNA_ORIENTATION=
MTVTYVTASKTIGGGGKCRCLLKALGLLDSWKDRGTDTTE